MDNTKKSNIAKHFQPRIKAKDAQKDNRKEDHIKDCSWPIVAENNC